ncbi:DUF3435 domain containing protein [Pyrenophora tritici-repentis]|nr:DUF3435 domain containing protein [Pyrenophora tritici-repentis]
MPPKKKSKVDLSHLRSLVHQENAPAPLTADHIKNMMIPSSFKAHQYIMSLWADFTGSVLQEPISSRIESAPTVFRIQLFLRWLAATRTGQLEENITDTTIRNLLSSLKRAIKLYTGYQYSVSQNKDLDNFIQKDLVQKNELATSAYTKPIAPLPVAEDLIQFMWMCDEYQHPHPRARLQLAFSVVLMTLLGSRPGEFIESGAWKHSNEGLLYGDIDLVRYQNGTYTGYLLHLRLRNRKGHRNNKKHSPTMLLYEEATMRSMCPVTYFIALALADGVFDSCKTFEDIEAKELPLGSSLYKYRYKPEAKQRPILRSISPNGTVSKNDILTYNCFNNMIKGIGQRAGYEERLSAYCFRRAFAKAVEKTATPAQRRLLMGHTNDDTVMYYISGLVGIDSQSMVHGREQKSELIDENTSMMLKRNLLAPMPPGSQLTDRLNRFTQFDSAFDLHKHMKKHLEQLPPLSKCPHPHCQSSLDSEAEFWSHAEDVHGMPPFGPRRATGKRKMPEDLDDMEDSTSDMNSGLQDCDNELQG